MEKYSSKPYYGISEGEAKKFQYNSASLNKKIKK
jgi:hypothetical protein